MFDVRLKKLRQNANLTQGDIAKVFNIPIRTYASYENNERELNSELLIRFADFFNVSTDYLLGISQQKNEFAHIKKAPDFEDPGIRLYKQLDEIDKASTCGYMKALLTAEKYKQDGTKMA